MISMTMITLADYDFNLSVMRYLFSMKLKGPELFLTSELPHFSSYKHDLARSRFTNAISDLTVNHKLATPLLSFHERRKNVCC